MALLETVGLTKRFVGVVALDGLDFAAESGEVHALVGANGAGKSTLMNLLSGVFPPSAGEIRLDGQPVTFRSPAAAREAGISTVYQELSSIPQLSVAENLFLGREPRTRLGRVDRERLRREAAAILSDSHIALDPDRLVETLSVAERQLAELARGLAFSARILILDEPTAVISGPEIDSLFAVIRRLKAQGRLVLYVSHRFEEVFAIADRITVLRDGRKILTAERRAIGADGLVKAMIGHALAPRFVRSEPPAAPPLLTARWEVAGGASELTVRPGEIVGLAGLVGAGRSEIALRLIGAAPSHGMAVELDGQALGHRSPYRLLRRGVVYLTEDRKRAGLFTGLSVLANTTASTLKQFSIAGIVGRRERPVARGMLEQLRLVYRGLDQSSQTLSGGNQQKLLLARALLASPRLLICDEPTRGVDVGAKEEIYAILAAIAERGVGILLISSEIGELVRLCHRLLVVRNHTVVATMDGRSASEDAVLAAAAGLTTTAAPP
ncbi:MAG TPA: sugar ABC transporter ATP-binding protein [Kiloniellales bacterium]|nr:sugar ABC transporter ATP-binding protein [Kiloniellales bacterium]